MHFLARQLSPLANNSGKQTGGKPKKCVSPDQTHPICQTTFLLNKTTPISHFHRKEKTLNIQYTKLIQPTSEIAAAFTRWENDPDLIPKTRPNGNQADLDKRQPITIEHLVQRLRYDQIYLIYLDGQLIGEINYQVDPIHLIKKEPGTVWIGISIGEGAGRGKGIDYQAMQYLEEQIK